MKEFWNMVQMVFAAVGGWLGYFLGGNDGLLIALVLFAAVDYLTGVMCAVSDKTLSSNVGFKGICRKVLIFLLVGIANILDIHVIGTGSVLRTAVIFFYISNEGVSLLENAAHLGCRYRERSRLSWNSSMTEPKKQKRRRNEMKLVQSILTKNPCYTAGRKITVKGLMLHSVGCPQPKASVFIKNWNSPSYDSACVHGFIDGNDGTVYQTLPGTTGAGTAALAARGAATTPMSAWRCVSLPVSSTQAGRILPVPISLRQRQWRSVLMRRQWNCLLICADSII